MVADGEIVRIYGRTLTLLPNETPPRIPIGAAIEGIRAEKNCRLVWAKPRVKKSGAVVYKLCATHKRHTAV